ncbi:MAG: PLP-dependent transferase [Planctomycetota bacterium]
MLLRRRWIRAVSVSDFHATAAPRPAHGGTQPARVGFRPPPDGSRPAASPAGLDEHPDHDLLQSLRHPDFGHGGLLAVDLGTQERAHQFMEYLQNETAFGLMAVSLGYSETLMSCSASSTSSELSEEDQRCAGIAPGLVRISVGYTGTLEQRWQQLLAGLRHLGMA